MGDYEDEAMEAGAPKRMDQDYKDDITVGNESEADDFSIFRPVTGWETIPELILEEVFRGLTFRERFYCSMVCKNWYDVFYSPRIWRNLEVDETTFTYTKKTVFGEEVILSSHRVKYYLARVGEHTRRIVIFPSFNFYDVYEFNEILSTFLEFFPYYPMPHLDIFEFTFACESRIPIVGPMILGTGGKFLDKLIHLIRVIKNLKRLVLNFLLLEFRDAPSVLEQVINSNSRTLLYFELLDFTKEKCPLFQLGMLRNMRVLVVTTHLMNDDVMMMMANNCHQLEEVVLVQDKYTPDTDPVSPETWKAVRAVCPSLRVRLQVTGQTRVGVMLQEKAPVWCILHVTPYATISTPFMHRLVDNYRNTLRVFGHLMLPRKHGPRTFHHRGDSGLVALVRHCPHLQTLYIRERLSSATLLMIAHEGRSLKELYVRRNAVILKSDWPKPTHWEEWRYKWMKKAGRSYDSVEEAISMILKQKWKLLSDRDYKEISVAF